MNMKTGIFCIAVLALALSSTPAQSEAVSLIPDDANTTPPNFAATVAASLLDDPFAYDPGDPTSAAPVNLWADGGFNFYHGPTDVAATIAFDFVDGTYGNLVIDLYGRGDCCLDRDDNLDIQFYLGGVLQDTVSGSVDDTTLHGRVTATAGTQADAIWIVDTGTTFNTTLAEIRVNGDPPPPPPVITPSSVFAVADTTFTLTVPTGGTGYQWSDEIGDLTDGGNISGSSTNVLIFDLLAEGDAGTYTATYDDGGKKTVVNPSYVLFVYPSGTTLPLAGLLGLGLLASACVVGGASVLRRKK